MKFLKEFLGKVRECKNTESIADRIVTSHNGILIFGGYDDEMQEFFIKIRAKENTHQFIFVSARGDDLSRVAVDIANKLAQEAISQPPKKILVRELFGLNYLTQSYFKNLYQTIQ